jgi:hypothetical protein
MKKHVVSIEYEDPYQVWIYDSISFSKIEESFKEAQNIDSLALEKTEENTVIKLSILLTSSIGWFNSISELFKALRVSIKNKTDFPNYFYINDFEDESILKVSKSVKAYSQWCEILSRISDHIEYENSGAWPNYIFVMEGGKSKKITTYKLPLKNLEDGFLCEIDTEPCDIKSLTNIDLHSYERKLVMRSSLIELYNDCDSKDDFLSSLLKSPKKLWDLFAINYEIYINKYSINKIINDVEVQKLDFLSKLNSLVQEHQTKSLTIPAVLVSTAIIKGWTPSGLLLIFVAMLLTCVVVIMGIHNAKNSLNDIIESSNKTMELFSKENLDDADLVLTQKVNGVINDALAKLKVKKKSADKMLLKLECMIYFGCSIWFIFVLYQFKDTLISFIKIFFTFLN